jgi:hypothetical protein
MVVHQAIGKAAPSFRTHHLTEHPEVDLTIDEVEVDRCLPVAPCIDVVPAVLDVLAGPSWHTNEKPGLEETALRVPKGV